ncbi:hypothetical protein BC940DRAFT_307257 [Gongronella butleri]|nr:hypothetical protein BC940DRAFT_307257 [Gongronella butleri]
MRVAVFGGSRGCAREMVVQGIESSTAPDFTLLVRNPDNIEYTAEQKAKVTLVKGNGDDKDAVRRAIEGADVVVSSIGGAMKSGKMLDPDVCTRCTKVLLEVIDELPTKPKRVVFVTSTGAVDKGEIPLLLRPVYSLFVAEAHVDKRAMEKVITSSCKVDYIIVRPSMLTSGALTKKYRTASKRLVGYTVSRADVGHMMLTQCLEGDKWLNKYVIVTN